MKTTAIVMSIALAFGTGAIAQTREAPAAGTQAQKAGEHSMTDSARQGAKRVGDATRSGAKRVGEATSRVANRGADAMRRTGQAIERKLPPGPNQEARRADEPGDTRAMGAGSADNRGDTQRQARMDDAYASWKKQQDKR